MTLQGLRRGDLAGAREIRLSGLSEFPRELFGLADTLEVLDIGGGTLTSLPDDFAKFRRLRILFASRNHFARLPPVLGQCESLSQIGFRNAGLSEIPEESLPRSLRWLILTDNRIAKLPSSLGDLPKLRKLMLAGNDLEELPPTMEGASALELVRIGANRFEALPHWLTRLPSLAWVSWAGNPAESDGDVAAPRTVRWRDLAIGDLLGEGTSGQVYRALWHECGSSKARPVALKVFRGAMTSDGLPAREIATCLAAGEHPGLTSALGRVADHPDGAEALLMPLVPPDYRPLAAPPSFETCTRDVYEPGLSLAADVALKVAANVAAAADHLHRRRLLHGDLYAHNMLWDGRSGASTLSDFGAASVMPRGASNIGWRKIEVRAWGLLLQELLERCASPPERSVDIQRLAESCVQGDVSARPLMDEALGQLNALSRNVSDISLLSRRT